MLHLISSPQAVTVNARVGRMYMLLFRHFDNASSERAVLTVPIFSSKANNSCSSKTLSDGNKKGICCSDKNKPHMTYCRYPFSCPCAGPGNSDLPNTSSFPTSLVAAKKISILSVNNADADAEVLT